VNSGNTGLLLRRQVLQLLVIMGASGTVWLTPRQVVEVATIVGALIAACGIVRRMRDVWHTVTFETHRPRFFVEDACLIRGAAPWPAVQASPRKE
jgi:hypothetical protein